MLSDIVEDWNEHLNYGLECLADIPRDVGCFLMRVLVHRVLDVLCRRACHIAAALSHHIEVLPRAGLE